MELSTINTLITGSCQETQRFNLLKKTKIVTSSISSKIVLDGVVVGQLFRQLPAKLKPTTACVHLGDARNR